MNDPAAIPIEEAEKAELMSPRTPVTASPYRFPDPSTIPPRQWLFGRHAVRKFISSSVAAGGTGKTANAIGESLALVSGKDILGDHLRTKGRAWYVGLEDPIDEYERRVAAAIKYYGLPQSALVGGLFLDSGRSQNFVIARQDRGNVVVAEPVVEDIIREIRTKEIALLTIDPFIASHTVSENDNGSIEVVARTWAKIADATGAAIELVHHVRKMPAGQEITADDARGARALVDKARSVRMLTGMTPAEAVNVGVAERRRYFRITFGKANLALPPENGLWRMLASVSLENGQGGPDDMVGVVQPWTYPNPLDEVSAGDLEHIIGELASGNWRADSQSKKWAGHVVAKVIGLDLSDDKGRSTAKALLKLWSKNGALRIEKRLDPDRRDIRDFIVPGK